MLTGFKGAKVPLLPPAPRPPRQEQEDNDTPPLSPKPAPPRRTDLDKVFSLILLDSSVIVQQVDTPPVSPRPSPRASPRPPPRKEDKEEDDPPKAPIVEKIEEPEEKVEEKKMPEECEVLYTEMSALSEEWNSG